MNPAITEKIVGYFQRMSADTNHRLRSWDHCFTHFRNQPVYSEQAADAAALHLGFYLASWGMYRGSSALLWKDYRVHIPAVFTLYSEQHRSLWELDFLDQSEDVSAANAILSLAESLKTVYEERITQIDGALKQFKPTDTLITKILLGTLACAPACDRYFIVGAKNAGLPYTRFDFGFLIRTFEYFRKHRSEFEEARSYIQDQAGFSYPTMKLVDMYFWTLGWEVLSVTDLEDP